MTISVENESGVTIPEVDIYGTAEKVIRAALDCVGCPYEAEVNLLITDNENMREINLDKRGIDRATDVLSFPMMDFEAPAVFPDPLDAPGDYFNPETGELLLGDIVVNAEKVIAQAEDYGHGYVREYAFLIAHSMLHLTGYDHESPDDAALMEKKQDVILDSLGISR